MRTKYYIKYLFITIILLFISIIIFILAIPYLYFIGELAYRFDIFIGNFNHISYSYFQKNYKVKK